MRTYNSEFFDSIDSDSSDVEFQQIITFGCLSSLLTWAENKRQILHILLIAQISHWNISQLHLPLGSCCTN